MLQLHLYFMDYEYKVSFKSAFAWNAYKQIILNHVNTSQGSWHRPDIYCLIQSLGWIYRFMNILNTPIPDTDVTHSSAAAFCSIPCVIAKLKNKTPFLLTEHGVYLREQYLGLGKNKYSSFLNKFLKSQQSPLKSQQSPPLCKRSCAISRSCAAPVRCRKAFIDRTSSN